jgi:hypothetical protein
MIDFLDKSAKNFSLSWRNPDAFLIKALKE